MKLLKYILIGIALVLVVGIVLFVGSSPTALTCYLDSLKLLSEWAGVVVLLINGDPVAGIVQHLQDGHKC